MEIGYYTTHTFVTVLYINEAVLWIWDFHFLGSLVSHISNSRNMTDVVLTKKEREKVVHVGFMWM